MRGTCAKKYRPRSISGPDPPVGPANTVLGAPAAPVTPLRPVGPLAPVVPWRPNGSSAALALPASLVSSVIDGCGRLLFGTLHVLTKVSDCPGRTLPVLVLIGGGGGGFLCEHRVSRQGVAVPVLGA